MRLADNKGELVEWFGEREFLDAITRKFPELKAELHDKMGIHLCMAALARLTMQAIRAGDEARSLAVMAFLQGVLEHTPLDPEIPNAVALSYVEPSEMQASEAGSRVWKATPAGLRELILSNKNRNDLTPDLLPEHERPLGCFIADSHSEEFVPLKSLDEARAHPDGIVILQGDDGGQIYVVARAATVACSPATLDALLADIDARCWDDPSMRRVFYERLPVGTGVAGGMGGAVVSEEPWIHQELVDMGLAASIKKVLRGERERLP